MDAANPDLVERWASSGELPTLGRLFAEGVSGRIAGLDGFFVGSTWPSLYTGVSPANHGHHSLVQLRGGTYRNYRCADDTLVAGAPFWQRLSDAGRRVTLLDVPLSELSTDLSGVQTVEWGSHDAVYGFCAEPRSVEKRIKRQFGSHPLGTSCDGSNRQCEDYRDLLERLLRGVRMKRDLTLDLLGDSKWNFAIQVFTESHCAGHQCWHLHDTAHPAHDERVAATIGDPLLEVYREIDRAIGSILQDHPAVPVVVLSAHGMSYWYGAQFLLKDILVRLGVTEPWPRSPAPGRLRRGFEAMARRAWHVLPDVLRSRVRRQLESLEGDAVPALPVDARKSLCFPVNNGLAVGGIRLNLRGREPEGRIEAGQEADAFCAALAEDLLAIRDERTGLPAIRAVRRTADLYHGSHLEQLPDLLVEWSDAVPTGSTIVGDGAAAQVRLSSPKIRTLAGTNHYGRTGEHRPEGFFVARLPHAMPAQLAEPVSLLDLAPTFCALLGVPFPSAEGTPIGALMRERGSERF